MSYLIWDFGWCGYSGQPLSEGQEVVDIIPQWLLDKAQEQWALMEQTQVEDLWRMSELEKVSNQLMAIEEVEAGGDVPDVFPGGRTDWLSYRTKVRAWKTGNSDFPDHTKRPTYP